MRISGLGLENSGHESAMVPDTSGVLFSQFLPLEAMQQVHWHDSKEALNTETRSTRLPPRRYVPTNSLGKAWYESPRRLKVAWSMCMKELNTSGKSETGLDSWCGLVFDESRVDWWRREVGRGQVQVGRTRGVTRTISCINELDRSQYAAVRQSCIWVRANRD